MGKVTTACNPCAVRKIKCTGVKPCPACIKSGFDCTYSIHSKRGPKGPRPATRARIDKTIELGQHPYGQEANTYHNASYSNPSLNGLQHSPTSIAHAVDSGLHYVTSQPPFTFERHASYSIPNSEAVVTPPPIIGESAFNLEDIATYFHIYQTLLYPVWPVVDHLLLLQNLHGNPHDAESCTLAFALCSALTARLRIDTPSDAPNTSPELATSKRFAELAESHRLKYAYRAKASIASILIPFFLHVHYDCQCRVFMDSMLLREAITVAQLMNIDKHSGYPEDISGQDRALRRKIFWLLFVSEKGCAMMRDFPTSLQPGLPFPDPQYEADPLLIMAFIALVKLFTLVNDVFGSGASGLASRGTSSSSQYNSPFFIQLQNQLGQRPDVGPSTHDAQKADILLTQQWLQILVWRFAVGRVNLSSKNGEETLSLTFPAEVAKHTLSTLQVLPFEAIVSHGRGMEQKIYEIASTLLDVINVVPRDSFWGHRASLGGPASPALSGSAGLPTPNLVPATMESPFLGTGPTRAHSFALDSNPVALLQSLSSILSIMGGRHSPYVALLQKKIGESKVPITPRVLGPITSSPALSATEGFDEAEIHSKIFWDTARHGPWNVARTASTSSIKEAIAIDWDHSRHDGVVPMNSFVPTPPLPIPIAFENSIRPLYQNGGHWPIGTEVLGTISDPKYLDRWGVCGGFADRQYDVSGLCSS